MKNKKQEKKKTINNLQHFTDIQTVLVNDARRGTYEDFCQGRRDCSTLFLEINSKQATAKISTQVLAAQTNFEL